MIDCEKQVYQLIKTEFHKQLPSFPDAQIQNFKKDFWYDDGIPKVWNKINSSEINKSYEDI